MIFLLGKKKNQFRNCRWIKISAITGNFLSLSLSSPSPLPRFSLPFFLTHTLSMRRHLYGRHIPSHFKMPELHFHDVMRLGKFFEANHSSIFSFYSFLRCKQKTICQGTAKLINGMIEIRHPHSEFCMPDDKHELISRFKESLSEALAQHWYKLKDLYDTLATV